MYVASTAQPPVKFRAASDDDVRTRRRAEDAGAQLARANEHCRLGDRSGRGGKCAGLSFLVSALVNTSSLVDPGAHFRSGHGRLTHSLGDGRIRQPVLVGTLCVSRGLPAGRQAGVLPNHPIQPAAAALPFAGPVTCRLGRERHSTACGCFYPKFQSRQGNKAPTRLSRSRTKVGLLRHVVHRRTSSARYVRTPYIQILYSVSSRITFRAGSWSYVQASCGPCGIGRRPICARAPRGLRRLILHRRWRDLCPRTRYWIVDGGSRPYSSFAPLPSLVGSAKDRKIAALSPARFICVRLSRHPPGLSFPLTRPRTPLF